MPAPRKPEPAPTPPSASERLAATQRELEETTRKITERDAQRTAALLADDNAGAIKLGIEITNLKLETRAHADKIALLKDLAAKEDQARKAKEREAQIEKVEAKIKQRDAAMQGVVDAIKQLDAASKRAIALGRDIVAMWTWAPHDLPVALLSPPSIMTSISHESFRLSYHPRRYGGMDVDPLAGVMLPGSKCPRLEWMEHPERTRPLLDVVADASTFAKQFMRTGRGSAAVEATGSNGSAPIDGHGEAPQRTEVQQRHDALLAQMDKLRDDVTPAGEAEYLRVVSELAKVQAEITAQQRVEQQHHG
jgi:hypothetical protein